MKHSDLDRKQHWERVYGNKPAQQTSWHQDVPRLSLSMIANTALGRGAALIDVGGGASLLVDHLLDDGYLDLSVLDISRAALKQARNRLGDRAATVKWIEADVTRFVPERQYDLWHDRAAFHFLTEEVDRRRYISVLHETLAPGGQLVIAAFAPSGPTKCSGLDIIQYEAEKLSASLGSEFILQEQAAESHITPLGREQNFNFFRFKRNTRDRKSK